MATCYVCVESMPDKRWLNHIRLFHPDELPETWPDGGVIYLDEEIINE